MSVTHEELDEALEIFQRRDIHGRLDAIQLIEGLVRVRRAVRASHASGRTGSSRHQALKAPSRSLDTAEG